MKKRILSYLPKAEDGLTVAQRALLKAKADQEAKNSQTETSSKSSVAKKPVTKQVVKTPSVVKKPIAPKPVVQQPVYNYSNWVGPTGFSQTNVGISKPSIVAAGVYSKGYTGHKTNSQQAVVEENIEESENQEPSLLDEVTEKAKRALGLYLNVGNEDPTVDVSQVKEIPINNTETNVNYNHFQKLNIPQDPGLFSYIRQGLNTDSLDYFTGPAKITYNSQNNKTPFSRSGVEGIGHHLIMSVAPDFTDFTDRSTLDYASRIMLQNTPDDNYIPIIRKHPGEKLKLTYRKRSDLAKEVGNYQPQIQMGPFTYSQTSPLSFKEIGLQKQKKPSNFLYNDPDVFSPLRLEQWKFGDLDFGDLGKTNVFKSGIEGVYDKKNKRYNRSLVTSGNLDSYGKFSGASTVFIFTDPKTKQEIVREVTGPLSLIKQEGEKIASDFGIDKNDITIGVYDAGSVNYKRAADNNYYMSPKRLYMEQTPGTMAGSSLLIPKGGKFKQGGTIIPKKQYAGPYTNEPTKEFSNFYKDIKQLYPNVSDEQILNYWQQGYADDFTAKNPFLATTPLIPGSQSTFEQYGISEPYINNTSYFNETPYPQKVRDIDYNEPLVYPTVVDNEEIPTRFTNPFLPESTKKLPGYLSQFGRVSSIPTGMSTTFLERMPTRSVTQIGSPSSLVYDPKKAKSVSKAINKLAKEDAEYRRNQREADEVILPTEESTSWRVNEEAPTSNADRYASEISKDWETVVPEFRVKTKPKVDTSPVIVDITSNPNYDWGYAMNNKGNIEYKTESPNFIERNAPVYKKGGYLPKALFGNMFKKNKQPYGPTAFTDQFFQWQDNSQTAKNAQRQPQANPMFMSGQNAPMTSIVDNIQGTGTELILNLNKPSNTNTKVEEDPLSWYEQDEAFDPLKVNFDKNTKSEPSFGQKVGAFAKGMWKGANADNILLGTKALNNLLEKTPDYDLFQRNYKEPGQSMSRGDWTTNQGFLQPNRLGYFDKFSVGTGSMQFGGELDMTDDEIYEFLAAGGELEFID